MEYRHVLVGRIKQLHVDFCEYSSNCTVKDGACETIDFVSEKV